MSVCVALYEQYICAFRKFCNLDSEPLPLLLLSPVFRVDFIDKPVVVSSPRFSSISLVFSGKQQRNKHVASDVLMLVCFHGASEAEAAFTPFSQTHVDVELCVLDGGASIRLEPDLPVNRKCLDVRRLDSHDQTVSFFTLRCEETTNYTSGFMREAAANKHIFYLSSSIEFLFVLRVIILTSCHIPGSQRSKCFH